MALVAVEDNEVINMTEEEHKPEHTKEEEKIETKAEPSPIHSAKKPKGSETTFWKVSTFVLAILFVLSLYTGGFNARANSINQPNTVNQKSSDIEQGDYDLLAQCLTDNGVVMYGTEWCPHCKDQKDIFGSSFQYINYVDCDEDGPICQAAKVGGYPTWVINGNNYPGGQSLDKLAGLAGCDL